MFRSVAVRQRGQLTMLLAHIVHLARQSASWREPDPRTLQTWRQLLFAVMVQDAKSRHKCYMWSLSWGLPPSW
jgi:hypothetical protein